MLGSLLSFECGGKIHLVLFLCSPPALGGSGVAQAVFIEREKRLFAALLFGQEHGMDVWENTTSSDSGSAEELVELLVVADGELHVAGRDAALLVVAGCVAGELKDLSAEVLEDGRHVDGGAASDAGCVAALLQVAGHTADRELKSGLGRARGALPLLLSASSFSFA